MSSFVPLLTGFLRRGRERRDLESEREFTLTQDVLQQKADEKTELAVQKLRNAGDLEEQALQNNATLSKVILDNYMDNNKDYLTFGGTDMTKNLLGLVTSGEFDTKPIDSSAIKEDYTFRFSKPDKDNPVKFLADVQGAIATNPDKFNKYFSANPDDLSTLRDGIISSIANYDKAFRTEDDGGRVILQPAFKRQFEALFSIPEFDNALQSYLGQEELKTMQILSNDPDAKDMVTVETEVDGMPADMKIVTKGLIPSVLGLQDDEAGNDKLKSVVNFMTMNDPENRTPSEIKNQMQVTGSDINEFARAMVFALPFGTKLNTANNLDTSLLNNYLKGNRITVGNNSYQTDYFKENEQRVADLFLFMTSKTKVTPKGNMDSTKYDVSEKKMTEVEDRYEAADMAISLTDDYLDILNLSEGYGLPDNQVIRNFIASFEGIRQGISSTRQYLAGQVGSANGAWAQDTLNRLDTLSGNINSALQSGITPQNRALTLRSITEFTQTALAYQVSMAFQGGSGGRTVSNEDFALVLRAIKGGPTDTYESQRYRLLSLRKFLQSPLVTSSMIIEHGVQGEEAAKMYDRYYRNKSRIRLNSTNNENDPTSLNEFATALNAEMNLAPQEGVFDDTAISNEYNAISDARSRIMIINIDPNDASKGQVAVMTVFRNGNRDINEALNNQSNIKNIILDINPDTLSDNRLKTYMLDKDNQLRHLSLDGNLGNISKNIIGQLKKGTTLSDEDRNSVLNQFNGLRTYMAPVNVGRIQEQVKESGWFSGFNIFN